MKFSNWTRRVEFKKLPNLFASVILLRQPLFNQILRNMRLPAPKGTPLAEASISPTFTLASSLKYLSLPKLYKTIFLPEVNNLWRMPASLCGLLSLVPTLLLPSLCVPLGNCNCLSFNYRIIIKNNIKYKNYSKLFTGDF